MRTDPGRWVEADPFELPLWTGERQLCWVAQEPAGSGLLAGRLVSGPDSMALALLAVDEAYPLPVVSERVRRSAHQAWRLGQILLVQADDHALAVPGFETSAGLACEAFRRFASAIAVEASSIRVTLTL